MELSLFPSKSQERSTARAPATITSAESEYERHSSFDDVTFELGARTDEDDSFIRWPFLADADTSRASLEDPISVKFISFALGPCPHPSGDLWLSISNVAS